SRAGLSMTSRDAWPRMQRKPRLSGLASSPLTPTSLPSRTSASIPQRVGWQFIGHIVRTVFEVGTVKSDIPVAMAGATPPAPLHSIPVAAPRRSAMQVALDGPLEAPDAFGDDLRRAAGEIQAHRGAVLAVRVEHAARHEGHLFLQGVAVQLVRVDAWIAGPHPDEHAAGRHLPLEPFADAFAGFATQGVAALPVKFVDRLRMLAIEAGFQQLQRDGLGEDAAAQVRGLLGQDELLDHCGGGDGPA